MELDLLPIKVSGSFRGSTWEFPLSVEVEAPLLPSIAASTNIFRGSFNELPYAPTYFHLLPRVSQTSSCFHKTDPKPKLEIPPWKLAHFQLDGSTRKSFVASMEAGTTYIEAGFLLTSMLEASASMEVDGSRWKLSWK